MTGDERFADMPRLSIDFDRFVLAWSPHDWWLRIGRRRRGLSVEPIANHRPLFSERFGTRRAWHVLGVCVYPLAGDRT